MKGQYFDYIDEIYETANKLFPDNISIVDSSSPDFLEFDIKNLPVQHANYTPKRVEISLDNNANFMLIDDYRWEFNNDTRRAEKEILRYLNAMHKGNLQKKGVRFLNERLDIVQ